MTTTASATPATPAAEYARRRAERLASADREARRYRRLHRARNTCLVLLIVLVWLSEKERSANRVMVLIPPLAIAGILSTLRERSMRAYHRARRAARFYERRLDCLAGRWAGTGEPGTRFLDPGHPSAADLDLFGSSCLFELLCTAQTTTGQTTLADWLRFPGPLEVVHERQAAVAEWRSLLDLREVLDLLAGSVPRGADLGALAAWGRTVPDPSGWLGRAVAWLLGGLGALAFANWVVGTGPLPFVVAVLVLGLYSLARRGRDRAILSELQPRTHWLAPLAALFARLEAEPFRSPRLARLRAELAAAGRSAARQVRWLDRRVSFSPVLFLTPWRTPLAFSVDAWRRECGLALGRWVAALGEFEALNALATYSYENPDDPFPELAAEGPCFDAKGLGHPLLPRNRCVRNDVRLAGERRVLVVSGSNMSGKSTLLRSVGVNVVLALAGAPVRATRLRVSALVVGSTLRAQDSLQAGHSRFYAEVLRVRQILDLARGPTPLLFLLDELFAGTNSHDRLIGAEAVVRRLADAGAIGLLTTHDLALTGIADRLAPRAANVHFADQYEAGKMTFDYRMRPGVVPHSNALALMRAVGIEV